MKRAARHSNASLLHLILLAALVALSPPAAFAQKPQDAAKLIQKGNEYLQKRDWKGARDQYQKAVRADARNVEANYGLGVAQMNLKQTTDALAAFSNVIAEKPNPRVREALANTGFIDYGLKEYVKAAGAFELAAELGDIGPAGYYFLGKSYMETQREAKALDVFRRATAEPQYAQDAYFNVGYLLVKQGKGREAVAPLEQAARLAPRHAPSQMLLGSAYLSADRPEDALSALRAADALAPNQFFTQLGLGFAHSSLYHNEEAMAAFNAALRLQPQSPEALTGLGGVYARMTRYREAEDSLARASALKPDDPNIMLAQAYLFYAQGQYPRLVETARQAARVAPQNAAAQTMLGAALAVTGDMAGGLRATREAARLEPENYSPHYLLGFILIREDKTQDALSEARTAARIRPNATETQNLLAYVLNQLGQHQEALQAAQAALQYKHESADEGWAYYNVASAQEKLGRAEESRANYTAAIRAYNQPGRTLDPDDLYIMGNAYLRLDQDPQAIKAFQQAIKVRPDFPQARYNLGLAYIATGNRRGAQDEYAALKRIDPARAAKLLSLMKR
ncbi:MAG TPA: tetratricopeptide repeat protein [Pyrinomonadaceae bacterium]|nr:tetratricopeptide repeat protein [Pyrinomonadaceae bacterium]